jgi:hypothetical protein
MPARRRHRWAPTRGLVARSPGWVNFGRHHLSLGKEDGNGGYTQGETQQDAYDIGDEPLFPMMAYPWTIG